MLTSTLALTTGTMVDQMLGCQLDLDEYLMQDSKQVSKKKFKRKKKHNVFHHAQNQTGHLETSTTQTEDDSALMIEESQEQAQRVHGRDKKGLFKNHTHFVELRNRINRQEHKHMKMFDKINLKLQDNNFVQQTFKLSSGEGAKAKVSIPGGDLPNKSPGTSKATAIQFINQMNEQVNVLWITFDGSEARYATLKAGEKYTQQTYDQHVWLIRGADDRKIMKYAAKESASDCIIKGGEDEGGDKCACIEFNKTPANCGQTYNYKGK
jgi:hypothetical protein